MKKNVAGSISLLTAFALLLVLAACQSESPAPIAHIDVPHDPVRVVYIDGVGGIDFSYANETLRELGFNFYFEAPAVAFNTWEEVEVYVRDLIEADDILLSVAGNDFEKRFRDAEIFGDF